MTQVKKARFANKVAKAIKNEPGNIPTQEELYDMIQESIYRFNDLIRACDDCRDGYSSCPCCMIGEIRDEVAKERDISIPYLDFLEMVEDDEWDGIDEKDQDNLFTLDGLRQHADVAMRILKNEDYIVGEKAVVFNEDTEQEEEVEITGIWNNGEIIFVAFNGATNIDYIKHPDREYPWYSDLNYDGLADMLQDDLKLPELGTVESGGQSEGGLTFAAYGW